MFKSSDDEAAIIEIEDKKKKKSKRKKNRQQSPFEPLLKKPKSLPAPPVLPAPPASFEPDSDSSEVGSPVKPVLTKGPGKGTAKGSSQPRPVAKLLSESSKAGSASIKFTPPRTSDYGAFKIDPPLCSNLSHLTWTIIGGSLYVKLPKGSVCCLCRQLLT